MNTSAPGRSCEVELAKPPARPQALHELSELPLGTAYVKTVDVRAHDTLVTLAYPCGRQPVLHFNVVPETSDDEPLPALRTVLAVRLLNRRINVDCRVIGTSASGARAVPIGLGQALALAASGVHTVFVTEATT